MNTDAEKTLLARVEDGDASATGQLFVLYSDSIKRMLALRLPSQLNARLDSSDVWQEVQLDASRRLPEYLEKREVPFQVWLRFLAKQKLVELVRKNLGTQARDARREQHAYLNQDFSATSFAIAKFLVDNATTPSMQLRRQEIGEAVLAAIDRLEENDREIIILRHMEDMSCAEAAVELGITLAACRKRHVRALQRLRGILDEFAMDWNAQNE